MNFDPQKYINLLAFFACSKNFAESNVQVLLLFFRFLTISLQGSPIEIHAAGIWALPVWACGVNFNGASPSDANNNNNDNNNNNKVYRNTLRGIARAPQPATNQYNHLNCFYKKSTRFVEARSKQQPAAKRFDML